MKSEFRVRLFSSWEFAVAGIACILSFNLGAFCTTEFVISVGRQVVCVLFACCLFDAVGEGSLPLCHASLLRLPHLPGLSCIASSGVGGSALQPKPTQLSAAQTQTQKYHFTSSTSCPTYTSYIIYVTYAVYRIQTIHIT